MIGASKAWKVAARTNLGKREDGSYIFNEQYVEQFCSRFDLHHFRSTDDREERLVLKFSGDRFELVGSYREEG